MKIRPLHKIKPRLYESNDEQWRFFENQKIAGKRNNPENREWNAYQRMLDGKFYFDTPYFYNYYPTLKSLVKALEKAKP
jgi:hypothetical protein